MTTSSDRSSGNRGRRCFLGAVLWGGTASLVATILYPVLRFAFPPKPAEAVQTNVVAAEIDELAPNSGKVFKFGNRPGLLIRHAAGSYTAFSAVCQHLQCTVQYMADDGIVWCACHNGRFNSVNGSVISGPHRLHLRSTVWTPEMAKS